MNVSAKILVVDDEPQIARVLRRGLETHGFEVRVASDGRSAMDLFQAWAPDLVVTDLAMPDMGGIELCRRLRKRAATPILVLSVKGEEAAKVEALDAGADDYVTKPFGMDELLARLRALLRRSAGPPPAPGEAFTVGQFRVDPGLRRVSLRGQDVHLTPKEYDLLLFFLAHHSRVLTHRAVLTAVWGSNSAEQNEYLRVFIAQLRKKLEANPSRPQHIRTEPWIGYRFEPGE